jgi:pyridoxine/pyridoxamine 5'-phosphate oxidase
MTESDPFALYQQWLNDFKAGDPRKDLPMCLSTVDADHKPSSRMGKIQM